MAQKMTRGEIQDLLAKFAKESPNYREALIKDPKGIMEKQLNTKLGSVNVKAVVESADTMYLVVPHVAKEGELGDADLEKVAGGFLDDYEVSCGGGTLNTFIQLNL